ncbi:MAG TPA: xanthine dehydrogenase family protein molybdopterin-binding subunit [Flavisolibacter sp.]|jgi:xanthine dehydrogenase YagR molybdenum-binding subunit|nr:xanthine dehydrogenase family protein molybdopterin-binding subunit [Flavisolibacter sp.]
MNDFFFDTAFSANDIDRVDGKAKVTGQAKYSAEYEIPGLTYGVLVGSNITRGTITAIDTKSAERSPGVLAVITPFNAPQVPGFAADTKPAYRGLKIFHDKKIYFNGQPIALVIADTFERATHAASLIKAQYQKEEHQTNLAKAEGSVKPLEGPQFNVSTRGEADAWKAAPVKVEGRYTIPLEVHLPMELHSTIVAWEGEEKVTVYDKTQGVKSTQEAVMQAFQLPEKNVQVNAQYVGGGFGSALRTWPHVIAALMGAKQIGKPLKLVLTRPQMFTLVGYRPAAIQEIAIGADKDGKLVGIKHEAAANTSAYEVFTEGIVVQSRALYACPNVTTHYQVYPLNLSTPTWMRGPGEATGSFALESALDELAYALGIDPLELRLRNYAETDPQSGKPYSSKFLREAYQLGADRIGWERRNRVPRSMQEEEWLVGYGMGGGMFGAFRWEAKVAAKLVADGSFVLQSAVADSGPGTATTMVKIASDSMGLPAEKVRFEMGDSSLPPGPTQGGSATTSTVGTAVSNVCLAIKKKLAETAVGASLFPAGTAYEDLQFAQGAVALKTDPSKKYGYTGVLQKAGLPFIELTAETGRNPELQKYSSYSYSVHFVKVKVHPLTGVVRIDRVVTAADAGTIVNRKGAESQMKGGAVGGIGMALMEEGVVDHRYGRWVNNNFADYHVAVHADVPNIEVVFVNKPDPVLNPVGSKGMGEIALIGFAAAVANAVFHATGKRVRELPITPDKVLL